MRTKFEIDQDIFFIMPPKSLDLVELQKIEVLPGNIKSIEISYRIMYKISYNNGNNREINESYIATDEQDLLHGIFNEVINIKTEEIKKIKQFLLKKTVNLKDIKL